MPPPPAHTCTRERSRGPYLPRARCRAATTRRQRGAAWGGRRAGGAPRRTFKRPQGRRVAAGLHFPAGLWSPARGLGRRRGGREVAAGGAAAPGLYLTEASASPPPLFSARQRGPGPLSARPAQVGARREGGSGSSLLVPLPRGRLCRGRGARGGHVGAAGPGPAADHGQVWGGGRLRDPRDELGSRGLVRGAGLSAVGEDPQWGKLWRKSV